MKSRGFYQQSEPRKYFVFSNSAASHTHKVIYRSIVCNWKAFRDGALGGRRKDWGRENGAPRAAPGWLTASRLREGTRAQRTSW